MIYSHRRLFQRGSVLCVPSSIPPGPDRRRVHVCDVLGEVAAADGCLARWVKLVSKVVQFAYELADLCFVEFLEVAGPVVFIAKSPDDYRGMVLVLIDHGTQHVPRLLLVAVTPQSAAAPRDLL